MKSLKKGKKKLPFKNGKKFAKAAPKKVALPPKRSSIVDAMVGPGSRGGY